MTTQNVAPTAFPPQKSMDLSQAGPKDGHSVTKRLQQDLMTLVVRSLLISSILMHVSSVSRMKSVLAFLYFFQQMSGDPSVSAFPDGDNLFRWVATIVGGNGTVYEGQSYRLSLVFPSRYPYNPPTVKFITHCFHPNVDEHGNICLDILKVRSGKMD